MDLLPLLFAVYSNKQIEIIKKVCFLRFCKVRKDTHRADSRINKTCRCNDSIVDVAGKFRVTWRDVVGDKTSARAFKRDERIGRGVTRSPGIS